MLQLAEAIPQSLIPRNINGITFVLRSLVLALPQTVIIPFEFVWQAANDLVDFELLEKSIQILSLEELIETYPKILKGEISGRVLVDLNK